MKILLVGSGGREHVIAWKLAQSKKVKKIYAATGNAGIYRQAQLVDIKESDHDNLIRFVKENEIDLTIVGPETPLANGIVDRFDEAGLKIFGPTKAAARIESSKAFAKQFMRKYHIPTASFMIFTDKNEATAFIEDAEYPLVIKADGLAAGKGVSIVKNVEEAKETIRFMMQDFRFGDAGRTIIIEEALKGSEASILAFTDGKYVIPLLPSQDHKQIGEGDTGPNTGGMGAYAPVPFISQKMQKDILNLILQPAVDGLAEEGSPFKGILYAGLMMTERGPKVIEFNCRFGDPEAQAVLPLMKTDLAELMEAVVNEELESEIIDWKNEYAVCVILASAGYPGNYEIDKKIRGLNDVSGDDLNTFHSGTTFKSGKFYTNGGRVLGVTATDEFIESAIAKAYDAVELIRFEGKLMRSDIGSRAANKIFESLE